MVGSVDVTAVKGNTGKRKPKLKGNPFPSGVPEKPTGLGEIGSAKWDSLVAVLSSIDGFLSPADAGALHLYCKLWDDLAEAEKGYEGTGLLAYTEKGVPYVHPAFNAAIACRSAIVKLASKLMLSPGDRNGKVRIDDGKEVDELSAMLLQRGRN